MNSNSKKIYSSMTIIWYFSIIYFSLGLIYPLFKTPSQIYNEHLLMVILYFVRNLVISLSILYCLFQLKKIILFLSNNTFFSFSTAHRFRNIGYGIMIINCTIIFDIIYHYDFLADNIFTGDSLKLYIIDIFISVQSPIVTFLSRLILGFIFILIAKVIKEATIMKNDIDQTV